VLIIIANYVNLASYPHLVINGEHSNPPHLSKAIDEDFRKQKSEYKLAYKTSRYMNGLANYHGWKLLLVNM
jgi:hypothetical protein